MYLYPVEFVRRIITLVIAVRKILYILVRLVFLVHVFFCKPIREQYGEFNIPRAVQIIKDIIYRKLSHENYYF